MIALALGIVSVFAIIAQAAVVWRVLRDAPVAREQQHEFMLAALREAQAQNVVEVAQADAIRDEARARDERVEVEETVLTAELGRQRELGFLNEDVVTGRAAMVIAGLNPDNPEDVLNWNETCGAGH